MGDWMWESTFRSTRDFGMPEPSQFRIIPERDELDQIQRDLKFIPSTNRQPTTLSLTDIQSFNQCGYLRPLPALDAPEIDDLRTYFDDLLERVLASGGNSYSISTAHLKYGRVYDLLNHAAIVAPIRDLLGNDVIGWGSHFFCKMPGDGKHVAWHQDASYWPMTPSKTATVWLAIDDADTENACMQFLPRSHLHGHLPYHLTEDSGDNVLNQSVDETARFGPPVDNVLSAGQMSIHSDLLLHGSQANHSHRRRCGLTLRYCTPDVRTGSGWSSKGVVVSGQDSTDYWGNPPRPTQD